MLLCTGAEYCILVCSYWLSYAQSLDMCRHNHKSDNSIAFLTLKGNITKASKLMDAFGYIGTDLAFGYKGTDLNLTNTRQ